MKNFLTINRLENLYNMVFFFEITVSKYLYKMGSLKFEENLCYIF